MGLLRNFQDFQRKGMNFEDEQKERRKTEHKEALGAKLHSGEVSPETALNPNAGNPVQNETAPTFWEHFKDALLPGQPFTGELGNTAELNSEVVTKYYQDKAAQKMAQVNNMDAGDQLAVKEKISEILNSHPNNYKDYEPKTLTGHKAMAYILGVASDHKENQIRLMKGKEAEAAQKWPEVAAKRVLAQDFFSKGKYADAGEKYAELIRESKQGYRNAKYVPEKDDKGYIQFEVEGNSGELQKVQLEDVGDFIGKVTAESFPKYEAAAVMKRQQDNLARMEQTHWFKKGDSKVMGVKEYRADTATGEEDEVWTFWKHGEPGVLTDKKGQPIHSMEELVNEGYMGIKDEKEIERLEYIRRSGSGSKGGLTEQQRYTQNKGKAEFIEDIIKQQKAELSDSGQPPMTAEDEAFNRERAAKYFDTTVLGKKSAGEEKKKTAIEGTDTASSGAMQGISEAAGEMEKLGEDQKKDRAIQDEQMQKQLETINLLDDEEDKPTRSAIMQDGF